MSESGEKIPKPTRRMEFSIDESSDEEYCTWVEVKMPGPAATRTTKSHHNQKPARTSKKAS
jgi:hypothetical protein